MTEEQVTIKVTADTSEYSAGMKEAEASNKEFKTQAQKIADDVKKGWNKATDGISDGAKDMGKSLKGSKISESFKGLAGKGIVEALKVGLKGVVAGVAVATPITFKLGKKSTFLWSLVALIVLCIAFYFVPTSGTGAYWTLMVLQILVCILTGVVSPLVWSMYADISDYAELKFKTASTGLIFSSSSMAQKFGGAFGASAVLWILAALAASMISASVALGTA